MPTILVIFGLRFYFYADEHLPIHVHLENGDGLAKIDRARNKVGRKQRHKAQRHQKGYVYS